MRVATFARAWARGLAWGLGSLLFLWALLWATGAQAWQGDAAWGRLGWGALLAALGTALGVSLLEEGCFRGLWLGWLSRRWPEPWALVLCAWPYALAHLWPPGRFQQPAWALVGLLLAGLVLGLGARRQGGWAFAWGLHAGWLLLFLPADAARLWRPAEGLGWWHGAGYPLGSAAGLLCLTAMAWWLGRAGEHARPAA